MVLRRQQSEDPKHGEGIDRDGGAGLDRASAPSKRISDYPQEPDRTYCTNRSTSSDQRTGRSTCPDLRVDIDHCDEQKVARNEYVDRYHYLGNTPIPGVQMKYFVYSGERLLALLSFSASAWKIAPRDWYIGWSSEKREENLKLVVNNWRFLVLPWVSSKNLASMILSRVSARLRADWMCRYRYDPLLIETFVERKQFTRACYRSANWKHIGSNKGRGKNDRFNAAAHPVKDIYLYPLHPEFKQLLC